MPNPKTGSNRWVPDIRPDKVETATETNEKQSEQYRIVDAHPILGGILDKLAYFRTHAGAVWYNKLAGITVLQKLDNLASNIGVLAQLATTDKTSLVAAINTLSSQVDSLNSQTQFYYGSVVKHDVIVPAKGTIWVSIPLEENNLNRYPLFPYGYYLLNGANVNIYAVTFDIENHKEMGFALYNPDNSSVTLTVQIDYVYNKQISTL